ncbi:hypothetical protein [Mediterraneibacter gnavus]|uniref:hypothetical protein n=1 Tax=Mediterraneibacter gnavus TaxID=33038 RepID=UPI00232D4578|nr:hypothetical protein [Mediterraneibacter gnavus]MDB8703359.1 hypothetical protein [Mediterraneibacter gnavus]MDB8710725.1 hypothetical protein [Mediterraneibacter gnavus]MDB8713208.1 hypothetical protein [Mediterraneibacter gnavus]MDB8715762.1 hypothetical protein [Mediterraneibacter gnavus]
MKKRNKMLLITSMVLAACGSLCLGRSLTTLPEKERPKTEQMQESETKEKDFEEPQEPQKEEEPVVPAQTVPVPKTGDSWW